MITLHSIKRFFAHPYVVTAVFFLFILAAFLHFYGKSTSSLVKQANVSYFDGEEADTIASRKIAFNQSLTALFELEEKYDPRFGNGILYFNLGNTLYQLEEYPMAILYYYRALALRPYDENVKSNLQLAQEKLGIDPVDDSSPFAAIFFFHNLFPLPLRLQLFFFITLLALIFGSLWIWIASQKMKIGTLIFGTLSIIMLMSLTFTYFLENPQAVIVEASYLYRGAGKQFATVGVEPLIAGSKVTVTQSEEEGSWLKVSTPTGEVGYLSHKAIRIIF